MLAKLRQERVGGSCRSSIQEARQGKYCPHTLFWGKPRAPRTCPSCRRVGKQSQSSSRYRLLDCIDRNRLRRHLQSPRLRRSQCQKWYCPRHSPWKALGSSNLELVRRKHKWTDFGGFGYKPSRALTKVGLSEYSTRSWKTYP